VTLAHTTASTLDPRTPGRPPRALAFAILAMSFGNVATIALGPLVLGVVQYPNGESVLNQLLGLEIVTLALVVPWSLWSALRCTRGDRVGPVLAIGPAGYTAYMLAQYVVGPEYGEYRVVALAHVLLFSIALGVTIWSFGVGCRAGLAPFTPAAGRRWALVLVALAMVVALRYLPAVVGSFTQAEIPVEFADARSFYWSIVLLDLGVVVPASVIGAVTVWRRSLHARVVVAAVLGWFGLVPPSVAAMATVMWVRDDPNASPGQTVLLWAIAIGAVGVAAGGLRQVIRNPERSSS
jgi:hypothetical protein